MKKAVVQIIIRADLVLIATHRYSLHLHKAQRYCWSYCENPLILDTPPNTVGPRNALNYVLGSSRNHVLRHKTRKIPPQVFAIFLAFPTFAVLSIEKCRKFFQGAKRCLLAPCPFRAIFFLKNNCENIWWLWKKSVILHSLNGTSGTPLTTATAKSSLKEIT
jgi:hypothetical protein